MTSLAIDGVDLHYAELGAGDPLLLVHGTGAYSAIWGEVPALLAASHRVIVYDRRGFGQSQGERAANAHRHALDAAALLEHLDAAPAVVVGWSGGGVLALDLAATRPDLVRSLVLIEPAFRLALGPSMGMLRMSARMLRARVRRDERGAAASMYRWANSYTSGGNGFERLPPDEQEGMLAHAPSTVREMDQLTRPAPSVTGRAGHRLPGDLRSGVAQRAGVPARDRAGAAPAAADARRRHRRRSAHASPRPARGMGAGRARGRLVEDRPGVRGRLLARSLLDLLLLPTLEELALAIELRHRGLPFAA